MPKVIITRRAEFAVRSYAYSNYSGDQCVELPNGDFEIELKSSTIAKVTSLRLPHETFSETLIRLVAIAKGLN